jgi:hypothetical protein
MLLDYKRDKREAQWQAIHAADWKRQQTANRGAVLVVKTDVRNRIDIRFRDAVRTWHLDKPERLHVPLDFGSSDVLLSVALNPEIRKSRSGSRRERARQITKYGKDSVEEAATVLEKKYGKEVAFLTLTLPGSTDAARKCLADNSSEIIDAFLSSMRSELRKRRAINRSLVEIGDKEQQYDYVFVWEFQRSGALHVHLCVALGDEFTWNVLKRNYRRWWGNVLETYGAKDDVDMFADRKGKSWQKQPGKWLVECEKVKKSVARYMAKYLSKTISKDAAEGVVPPRKFWGMGASLMAEVKAYRRSQVLPLSDFIEARREAIKAASIAASFADSVRITRDKFRGRPCAFVMYFEESLKEGVFAMLRALLDRDDVGVRLTQMPAVQFGPPDIYGEVLAA